MGLYFSGEGRMYSLLLLLILGTAWTSLVLRQRAKSTGHSVLWVVLSAAGFLTHYFFALPWLALVLFLFLRPGEFDRWRLLICLCFVGLVLLPWYIAAAAASSHWRVTQGWLSLHPTGYNRFRAIRNQIVQFFSGGGTGFTQFRRWSSFFSLSLFILIAGIVAWRLRWQAFQGSRLMLWLWFVVAAATPSLIDLLSGTYFTNNARYALPALPGRVLTGGHGYCLLCRPHRDNCAGAHRHLLWADVDSDNVSAKFPQWRTFPSNCTIYYRSQYPFRPDPCPFHSVRESWA